MFLHEQENWTDFTWDAEAVASSLGDARFAQGKLLGELERVGFDLAQEAEATSLASEVVASSGIEGVQLDAAKVRSSVARRLGIEDPLAAADTHDVDGAVDIVFDATSNCWEPLTAERLFSWHAALFPTGYSGLRKISVGQFRKTPMEVVSGPIGHEKIHFVAPAPERVDSLMAAFVEWFNGSEQDPLIVAGAAHLRFLTIHPFEDGNGRIARAMTELLLSRSDGSPRRFYSMSSYIAAHRNEYYNVIERAQRGGRDITGWLTWFLGAVKAAASSSSEELSSVVERSAFWASVSAVPLNDRQRKVLGMLVGDFEGKLTTRKWAKICKVSPDTALRDINDLIEKGVLVRDPAGGRSTSYSLSEGN